MLVLAQRRVQFDAFWDFPKQSQGPGLSLPAIPLFNF